MPGDAQGGNIIIFSSSRVALAHVVCSVSQGITHSVSCWELDVSSLFVLLSAGEWF